MLRVKIYSVVCVVFSVVVKNTFVDAGFAARSPAVVGSLEKKLYYPPRNEISHISGERMQRSLGEGLDGSRRWSSGSVVDNVNSNSNGEGGPEGAVPTFSFSDATNRAYPIPTNRMKLEEILNSHGHWMLLPTNDGNDVGYSGTSGTADNWGILQKLKRSSGAFPYWRLMKPDNLPLYGPESSYYMNSGWMGGSDGMKLFDRYDTKRNDAPWWSPITTLGDRARLSEFLRRRRGYFNLGDMSLGLGKRNIDLGSPKIHSLLASLTHMVKSKPTLYLGKRDFDKINDLLDGRELTFQSEDTKLPTGVPNKKDQNDPNPLIFRDQIVFPKQMISLAGRYWLAKMKGEKRSLSKKPIEIPLFVTTGSDRRKRRGIFIVTDTQVTKPSQLGIKPGSRFKKSILPLLRSGRFPNMVRSANLTNANAENEGRFRRRGPLSRHWWLDMKRGMLVNTFRKRIGNLDILQNSYLADTSNSEKFFKNNSFLNTGARGMFGKREHETTLNGPDISKVATVGGRIYNIRSSINHGLLFSDKDKLFKHNGKRMGMIDLIQNLQYPERQEKHDGLFSVPSSTAEKKLIKLSRRTGVEANKVGRLMATKVNVLPGTVVETKNLGRYRRFGAISYKIGRSVDDKVVDSIREAHANFGNDQLLKYISSFQSSMPWHNLVERYRRFGAIPYKVGRSSVNNDALKAQSKGWSQRFPKSQNDWQEIKRNYDLTVISRKWLGNHYQQQNPYYPVSNGIRQRLFAANPFLNTIGGQAFDRLRRFGAIPFQSIGAGENIGRDKTESECNRKCRFLQLVEEINRTEQNHAIKVSTESLADIPGHDISDGVVSNDHQKRRCGMNCRIMQMHQHKVEPIVSNKPVIQFRRYFSRFRRLGVKDLGDYLGNGWNNMKRNQAKFISMAVEPLMPDGLLRTRKRTLRFRRIPLEVSPRSGLGHYYENILDNLKRNHDEASNTRMKINNDNEPPMTESIMTGAKRALRFRRIPLQVSPRSEANNLKDYYKNILENLKHSPRGALKPLQYVTLRGNTNPILRFRRIPLQISPRSGINPSVDYYDNVLEYLKRNRESPIVAVTLGTKLFRSMLGAQHTRGRRALVPSRSFYTNILDHMRDRRALPARLDSLFDKATQFDSANTAKVRRDFFSPEHASNLWSAFEGSEKKAMLFARRRRFTITPSENYYTDILENLKDRRFMPNHPQEMWSREPVSIPQYIYKRSTGLPSIFFGGSRVLHKRNDLPKYIRLGVRSSSSNSAWNPAISFILDQIYTRSMGIGLPSQLYRDNGYVHKRNDLPKYIRLGVRSAERNSAWQPEDKSVLNDIILSLRSVGNLNRGDNPFYNWDLTDKTHPWRKRHYLTKNLIDESFNNPANFGKRSLFHAIQPYHRPTRFAGVPIAENRLKYKNSDKSRNESVEGQKEEIFEDNNTTRSQSPRINQLAPNSDNDETKADGHTDKLMLKTTYEFNDNPDMLGQRLFGMKRTGSVINTEIGKILLGDGRFNEFQQQDDEEEEEEEERLKSKRSASNLRRRIGFGGKRNLENIENLNLLKKVSRLTHAGSAESRVYFGKRNSDTVSDFIDRLLMDPQTWGISSHLDPTYSTDWVGSDSSTDEIENAGQQLATGGKSGREINSDTGYWNDNFDAYESNKASGAHVTKRLYRLRSFKNDRTDPQPVGFQDRARIGFGLRPPRYRTNADLMNLAKKLNIPSIQVIFGSLGKR